MRAKKDLIFQKAPLFTTSSGGPLSTYKNKQAKAWNDHLETNAGDCVYRTYVGLISMGRNMFLLPVVTDEEGETLKPTPIHEFLLETDWSGYDSSNVTVENRMAMYVFGCTSSFQNVDNVSDKLLTHNGVDIFWATTADTNNPAVLWDQLKALRGYTYVENGDYTVNQCPAIVNTQKYLPSPQRAPANVYNFMAPAFAPQPDLQGTTYIVDDVTYPSLIYKFTDRTNSANIKTYTGTAWSTGGFYLLEDINNWYIYIFIDDNHNTRLYEVLPKSKWVQGPYSGGGALSRYSNTSLFDTVFNNLTKANRGSLTNWIQRSYRNEYTFDFQSFLTRPYYLAPAYGVSGSGAVDTYFSIGAGTHPINTLLTCNHGGTSYGYHDGFIFTDAYVELTNCTSSTGNVSVTFIDSTGSGSNQTFQCPTNTPIHYLAIETWYNQPTLQVKLTNIVTGSVKVSVNEIQYRKATHLDAYYVTRLGGLTGTDQYPSDYNYGKIISDNYLTYHLPLAVGSAGINIDNCKNNNEMQSFNEFVHSYFGYIPNTVTNQHLFDKVLVGYEATENESSIYIDESKMPTGYYDRIKNIKNTADEQGYSNEWLAMEIIKPLIIPASIEESNMLYSNNVPLFNRSLFAGYYNTAKYNDILTFSSLHSDYYTFFRYGRKNFSLPEWPDAYNFYGDLNTDWLRGNYDFNYPTGELTPSQATQLFAKANKLYNPPYKIKSAVVVPQVTINGSLFFNLLKITFTERFDHDESAPMTVSSDNLTWPSLLSQGWRNLENACMDYIQYLYTGVQPPVRIGDYTMAAMGGIGWSGWWDYPPVFVPEFFLIKEIPYVREDGNDTPDIGDTRRNSDEYHQLAFHLKASCNGFVAGDTSLDYIKNLVQVGGMSALEFVLNNSTCWDYTWDNLLLELHSRTDMIAGKDDNKVVTYGFGPFPKTKMTREVFNQYSNMINRLYRFRLILPNTFVVGLSNDWIKTSDSPGWVVSGLTGPSTINPGGLSSITYQSQYNEVTAAEDVYTETGNVIALSARCIASTKGDFNESIFSGFYTENAKYAFRFVDEYDLAIPYNVSDNNIQFLCVEERITYEQYGIWEPIAGTVGNNGWIAFPNDGYTTSQIRDESGNYWNIDLSRTKRTSVLNVFYAPAVGEVTVSGTARGDMVVLAETPNPKYAASPLHNYFEDDKIWHILARDLILTATLVD